MNRSMILSSVTMGQLQKKLDTISHNLANVDTTGYKSRSANFSELLAQEIDNYPSDKRQEGRKTPDGIRMGVGAYMGETELNMQPGSFKVTGRDLDVAITKKNQFFQIEVEADGQTATQYTRDGSFYVNSDYELVTNSGDRVLGADGPITFPSTMKDVEISIHGQIVVKKADGTDEVVGQLQLAEVKRPQVMLSQGGNKLALPPNLEELNLTEQDILTAINDDGIKIQQGALESSNVDMSKEMTEMVSTQRHYQFNARAITMADEMMGLINNLR